MSLENRLKQKIEEWKNIKESLEKLDSKEAKQLVALHREHISELEDILRKCQNEEMGSLI